MQVLPLLFIVLFITNYACKFMQTERFLFENTGSEWTFTFHFFYRSFSSLRFSQPFVDMECLPFWTMTCRNIQRQVRDGNITTIPIKILSPQQKSYLKMNGILTWFQHNFVSLFRKSFSLLNKMSIRIFKMMYENEIREIFLKFLSQICASEMLL